MLSAAGRRSDCRLTTPNLLAESNADMTKRACAPLTGMSSSSPLRVAKGGKSTIEGRYGGVRLGQRKPEGRRRLLCDYQVQWLRG